MIGDPGTLRVSWQSIKKVLPSLKPMTSLLLISKFVDFNCKFVIQSHNSVEFFDLAQEERDVMKQKKDGLNVRVPSKNAPGKSINDDDEKTKLIQKEGVESVGCIVEMCLIS